MGNRWFERHPYTPFYARRGSWQNSPPPAAGSNDPNSRPSQGGGANPPPPGTGGRAKAPPDDEPPPGAGSGTGHPAHGAHFFLTHPIAAGISIALSLMAAGASLKDFFKPAPQPVVVDVKSAIPPIKLYGAIKLQRAPDAAAARKLIGGFSAPARSLSLDWNGGPHHFIFTSGSRKNQESRPYYLATPREGWEKQFENIIYSGLQGLNLYEIEISKNWSSRALDNFLYRLAAECNVDREWIPWWSSFRSPEVPWVDKAFTRLANAFRPPLDLHLTNECVPGGRCFVISMGCSANAFDGLNPAAATD